MRVATAARFAELEVRKFTSHSPRPAAAPSDSPQLPRPEVTRRGPSPSPSHSPRLDVTRRGPSPSHWSWQSPRPAVTRHGRRGGPSHSLQPESESAAAARVTGTSPLAVTQARRGPSHSPRPAFTRRCPSFRSSQVTRRGPSRRPTHWHLPRPESLAAAQVSCRRGPGHSPSRWPFVFGQVRARQPRYRGASRRLHSLLRLLGPARAAGRSQASLKTAWAQAASGGRTAPDRGRPRLPLTGRLPQSLSLATAGPPSLAVKVARVSQVTPAPRPAASPRSLESSAAAPSHLVLAAARV